MDRIEAKKVLAAFLEELEGRSYKTWRVALGEPVCVPVEGPSGKEYQVEYEAFWDAQPGGDIRVLASIDDARFLSALFPVTLDFVVSPGESGDVGDTRALLAAGR